MTGFAFFPPSFTLVNSSGRPYAGAVARFYQAGTNTGLTVYTTAALSTAHGTSVTADAGGVFPAVFIDPEGGDYKVSFFTSSGSLIRTVDNLPATYPLTSAQVGAALYPRTAAEIAANVTPSNYSYPEGNAKRYGAVGNGSANDTEALADWWDVGKQGVEIFLPAGTYLTTAGLRATAPIAARGDHGARIKVTAAANYVIQLDYTGGGFDHGGLLRDLILDGGGHAVDGLSLKGVISASFDNIRATNVTTAGLHLHWAQLCEFNNFICSNNVETFTTIPVNGVLVDTASSSANIFKNLTVEHVSGAGVKGVSLVNTLFLNGTSEGNDIGLRFGETSGALTSVGNVVVGMDLEVNTTTDIQLLATAQANTFLGVSAGFESPAVDVNGGLDNVFVGGITGGFDFDASANRNQVYGTKILGAGRGITDAGTGNAYVGVFNISDANYVKEKSVRGRTNHTVSATGSVAINAAETALVAVTFDGGSATEITFSNPTNPTDGAEIEIVVHCAGAGALTYAWGTAFKQAGVVIPANGYNRSYRFRYDANYTKWYLTAQSPADIPN